MEDIAAVEDIVQAGVFFCDINFADGSMIGEYARSVGKYSNTVLLLPYISHFCYVSNINSLFKAYRCPSCDQFIKTAQHRERHVTTFKERVKHVFHRTCVNRDKPFLTT